MAWRRLPVSVRSCQMRENISGNMLPPATKIGAHTTMVEVPNGGAGQTGFGTHTTKVKVPNGGAGKTTKVGGDNSFIDSEDIAKRYLTAVAADNDRSGFIPLDD